MPAWQPREDDEGDIPLDRLSTMSDMQWVEKYMGFKHLPEHLKTISSPHYMLAKHYMRELPPCQMRTLALQHLWEAKNAAVCALL